MRILVIEPNLIWSSRIVNAAMKLGHQVQIAPRLPDPIQADVAIVNLAYPSTETIVATLREAGAKVVAHAGHKEKERLKIGKVAGCDLVVSNSELTFKLAEILGKVISG